MKEGIQTRNVKPVKSINFIPFPPNHILSNQIEHMSIVLKTTAFCFIPLGPILYFLLCLPLCRTYHSLMQRLLVIWLVGLGQIVSKYHVSLEMIWIWFSAMFFRFLLWAKKWRFLDFSVNWKIIINIMFSGYWCFNLLVGFVVASWFDYVGNMLCSVYHYALLWQVRYMIHILDKL